MDKKGLLLALALLLAFSLTACGGSSYNFDETDMHLVQFETPADDAPVAHVATSMGDVWFVLYPDEAPVACENFMTLAGQGWYDGTEFFRIEPKTACIAGSKTTDGNTPTTIYNEEKFENEYTMNVWPFAGAVGTISNEDGKSDSRFFFIGDIPITDEYRSAMEQYGFPESVREKFDEVGGVPPFTQRYTIFGQIVKGMDVVDAINALETNDDQYPTGDPVVIESITLTTYGEIDA